MIYVRFTNLKCRDNPTNQPQLSNKVLYKNHNVEGSTNQKPTLDLESWQIRVLE